MRPHNAKTCDMSMLYPIHRLFLHLCKHIPHDLRRVVGRALRTCGIDGDEGELRPAERVVEIVLEEVVLGEIGNVGGLHVGDI